MKLKYKIFILVIFTIFLTGFTQTKSPQINHVIQVPTQMVSPTPLDGMVLNIEFAEVGFTADKYHEFVTYGELGVDAYEFWDLVYLTYTEANLENETGQIFITYSVMSRVGHEGFPDTIQSVIFQDKQFCGTSVDSWGTYTQENVENVMVALKSWNSDKLDEKYRVMTFFNNPKYVSRGYPDRYGLELIEEVGGHRFYGYKEDLEDM